MTQPVKIIGLTALILLLAGSLWIANNSWHGLKRKDQTSVQPVGSADGLQSMTTGTSPADFALEHRVLISTDLSRPLPNPFVLSGILLQLEAADWVLEDSDGIRLAEGRVTQDDGIWNEVIWYEQIPRTQSGFLKFYATAHKTEPLVSYEVELETQTQTVELFFKRRAADMDCSEVLAVKRDLVSTSGHKLNYYEAVLHELVKGPTSEEAEQGWLSAIPEGVRVRRVGVDEKGRLVGDFSKNLFDDPMDDCRKSAVLAQIEQTLATVPVNGRRMPGKVYVEGQEVGF